MPGNLGQTPVNSPVPAISSGHFQIRFCRVLWHSRKMAQQMLWFLFPAKILGISFRSPPFDKQYHTLMKYGFNIFCDFA
jgi:hypothetical protein